MSQFARDELSRVAPHRPSAVTIGTFDGVHRGHQHLIGQLRDRASARGLTAGVVTLYPNPAHVLRPQEPVMYLTSLEERIELLHGTGLDFVAPLTFTSEMAELSAEEFGALLVQELSMAFLLMGPDHAFGRGREGTPERMREVGRSLGFDVDLLEQPLSNSVRPVSSTTIRSALAEGDIALVTHQLGRHYSIRGPVVHGDHRGRELGYPTANIAVAADRALPAFGVYATWAHLGPERFASATSVGNRPTFDGKDTTVEAHILDFDREIYGQTLAVEFVARVSPELKFTTADELKVKIASDVAAARELLKG